MADIESKQEEVIYKSNPSIMNLQQTRELPFKHTLETLIDTEEYAKFIYNIEYQFRHSKFYRDYKANIYAEGFNYDQQMRNITADMADIELHHHLPTLKEAAIVLTEYYVRTYGEVCTMDIIELLIWCHRQNLMGTIMLTSSMHQAYHNDPTVFISIGQLRGKPFEFIDRFGMFFTLDIAMRYLMQFKQEEQYNGITQWPQIPRALAQLRMWTDQGYIQY